MLWLEQESLLDPVTAISGSGPAYVFYFIEALQEAGRDLGFTEEQARQLAVETFAGAASLARLSPDPVHVLRERVTSKGGTTAAALTHLEASQVRSRIIEAVRAACARAEEMGGSSTPTKPTARRLASTTPRGCVSAVA